MIWVSEKCRLVAALGRRAFRDVHFDCGMEEGKCGMTV